MASDANIPPAQLQLEIPDSLREFLRMEETPTHFAVRTLSGSKRLWPKLNVQYPWQLLRGIMDDQKNTSEERKRERNFELSIDERKLGVDRPR
jgi:hypothetical protein